MIEGNKIDVTNQSSTHDGIDQAIQNGISTPRPDSGFVGEDENEVADKTPI